MLFSRVGASLRLPFLRLCPPVLVAFSCLCLKAICLRISSSPWTSHKEAFSRKKRGSRPRRATALTQGQAAGKPRVRTPPKASLSLPPASKSATPAPSTPQAGHGTGDTTGPSAPSPPREEPLGWAGGCTCPEGSCRPPHGSHRDGASAWALEAPSTGCLLCPSRLRPN